MTKLLLQLNVTANWGSTGKIAEGIGLAAMARGWESAIAYGRYMNPSQSRLIKVGNQLDVYAHYAKNRFLDGEGLGSKRATRQLVKQIQELAPDIIHLHNIHDHWLNYPILFEYLASIDTPVVWTFHDCWAFTGGCFHFENTGCDKWKSGCHECPSNHNFLDRCRKNFIQKIKLISNLEDRLSIISVSKWLDSLVAGSKLGHLRHSFIYNGLDTEAFRPQNPTAVDTKYGLTNKHVLLGVSNVWSNLKGLDDYNQLSELLPDDHVIVLVGVSKSLQRTLAPRILGIPRTDSIQELATLYSRADAVLSLSKAETFGMTLAEGLACGTPSIGYSCTAIKELITNQTGIAVEKGNISQVKQAVLQITQGSLKFDSKDCRKKATECFNRDIQFGKYIDLYEALLSRKANVLDV